MVSYKELISAIAKHLEERIREIDGIPYLLTVTFSSAKTSGLDVKERITPRSARSILKDFEHCYGCLMNSKKLLRNNYERKFHLRPLTYAFVDFSHGIHVSGVDERKPGTNAHIHAIMIVHPHTLEKLKKLGSRGLEEFFKSHCRDIATVDLRKIENLCPRRATDKNSRIIRKITAATPFDPVTEYKKEIGALRYASKALKRERDEENRADMFTFLPDSSFRPPSRVERLLRIPNRRR